MDILIATRNKGKVTEFSEYFKPKNINIYDLTGKRVKSLVNSKVGIGFNQVEWDATNSFGQTVAAGVYIYVIEVGDFRSSKKMILLK